MENCLFTLQFKRLIQRDCFQISMLFLEGLYNPHQNIGQLFFIKKINLVFLGFFMDGTIMNNLYRHIDRLLGDNLFSCCDA